MKSETGGKIKFGVWGLIVGAIVTMIIGFSFGGWATSSTVKNTVNEALASQAGDYCAASFKADLDYKDNLEKLKAANQWSRSDFIGKGGWAKTDSDKVPSYAVEKACVAALSDVL